MALGGCGNEADGARANHEGSSTGQRQQHGGRPLVWEGNGTANRSGSGDQDACHIIYLFTIQTLKIRAEEDQEKERDIDKEIDPSALLMDTTMFDETNPIMEWLNEDVEDPIVDGADAASAVFEQIRRLNSSRKASYVGSKGNNKKRKRNDDDENEFLETESEDDEEENEYVDNDIEDDDGVSEDDEDGEQDQLETQMQLEEETQVQVQKEAPTSTGHLETRSGRLIRKKTKNVNSLYS
ncbi:ATP-dependent RNA helicase DRS1 [Triticum aestivum]|uniref:ATP-dependent RNA helicase DRS1 n=1 Tax=Triticum aestivum TaxID=4565 RepID=UPI001D020DA5|nr:ATP-dependent RNA helicase DRS1-like [Triticum aestivum]